MDKTNVRFIGNEEIYSVIAYAYINKNNNTILHIKFNSVDDIPDNNILLSGIYILDKNYNIRGIYEDYRLLYRKINDVTYELSNKEIYVDVNSTIIEPTNKELKNSFENNKSEKIEYSKYLLEKYLSDNPLKSSCHNNSEDVYTVTSEKQTLMANNYLTYTISKEINGNAVLTWNSAGKECEEWTEEEYLQLLLEISEYVKPLISLQQKYEVQINNCKTQEELDNIIIEYGV